MSPQFYRCQHRYILYDTVVTSDDGDIVFVNTTGGTANSFDIDLEEGAITGKTGICVDLDSSMNEGCSNQVAAGIKDSLVGCFDAGVGKFLCGLSVEAKNGDLRTVSIEGNLFWPRVLIAGSNDADGDGAASGELKCYDPIGERNLLTRPFSVLSPSPTQTA